MTPFYERAWLLYQKHRYRDAVGQLQQALTDNPSDADAHALWALCLAGEEQYSGARTKVAEAIHHGPDVAFPHYARAFILRLDGHRQGGVPGRKLLTEALASTEEALRLGGPDPHVHWLKARLLLEMDSRREAAAAVSDGLALDPTDVDLLNLQTELSLDDAPAGLTIEAAREALSRAPDDAACHHNLGAALLRGNRPDAALEHFVEALRLSPTWNAPRRGALRSLKARHRLSRWLGWPRRQLMENRAAATVLVPLGLLAAAAYFMAPGPWQRVLAVAVGVVMLLAVVVVLASRLLDELLLRRVLAQEETRIFVADDEVAGSHYLWAMVAWLALAAFVVALGRHSVSLAAAASLAGLAIPWWMVRRLRPRSPSRVFAGSCILAGVAAIIAVACGLLRQDGVAWTFTAVILALQFVVLLHAAARRERY